MKWNKQGFDLNRGNRTSLIAKFNNSDFWFDYVAITWTGNQIETFREIGKMFGSESVEVKPQYDENGNPVEPEANTLTAIRLPDENGEMVYKFRQELEVDEGCRRQFKYFELDTILKKEN